MSRVLDTRTAHFPMTLMERDSEMKVAEQVAAILAEFIADPKGYLGSVIGKEKASTRMAFGGIRKEEDVRDLIAYMKEAAK